MKYFTLRFPTVLSLYAKKNGGPLNTRLLLATAMREGKLRVKAGQMWESGEPSLLRAWRQAPPLEKIDDKVQRKICNRSLWWKSVRWLEDVYDWDLSRGRLVITLQERPLKRLLMKGVRLHSGDAKNVLTGNSVDVSSSQPSGFNKENWRWFWHEMVVLAAGSRKEVQNSELACFTSDEKLLEAIKKRVQSESEILAGKELDDEELAKALTNRSPDVLQSETVHLEIKAFRQALKLKSWGKNSAAAAKPAGRPAAEQRGQTVG